MLDLVKKFFGKNEPADAMEPEPGGSHDIQIATCALFLEMANIDGEFSAEERRYILALLKERYRLSNEDAAGLVEASGAELDRSIDLWRFARLINENYPEEEKIQIVELAWRIVYVDGTLHKHEDYLVHKLSKLLRLSHKQLIEAKLKVIHGNA